MELCALLLVDVEADNGSPSLLSQGVFFFPVFKCQSYTSVPFSSLVKMG